MIKQRWTGVLFSAGALLIAAAMPTTGGCGKAHEYCDARCECEHCNDREFDDCVISIDNMIDRAEAYECGDDFESYRQCVIDNASCEDFSWSTDADDCDSEAESAGDCEADATAIEGGGSGNGNGNGSPSSGSSGGGDCVCDCPSVGEVTTPVSDCSVCQGGCEDASCSFVGCG